MDEVKDGGHGRLWPKAKIVKVGDVDLQIVAITIEDMEGWQSLMTEILGDLSGKESVTEQEFFKLLLQPSRVMRAMDFIIRRERQDDDGKKIFVNDFSPRQIKQMDLSEMFDVVAALGEISNIWDMLGKAKGLWSKVGELTNPTPAARKPRSA